MDKETKNLMVFGYGLGVIAAFFGITGALKHGVHFFPVVCLVCSGVFIAVTILQRPALKPAYQGWMKASYVISQIVTGVILTMTFVCIFTPISLLFKLMGKDHLERKIDPLAGTYWCKRRQDAFEPEQYRQQF